MDALRASSPLRYRRGRPIQRAIIIFSTLGGEGGIRTHETCEGPPVFKTGAFNRSATSPGLVRPFGLRGDYPRFRSLVAILLSA